MKGEVIDGIKYRLDEDNLTAKVIKKNGGYKGDIILPKTIEFDEKTYRVTSIGAIAFDQCESLTSVVIPDSVTSIGDCAFGDCKSLNFLTIPDSIKSIGKEAFYCCKSLKTISYGGTIAQWKKINLANDMLEKWNRRSAINVVHCTDGNMWVY